MNDLGRLFAPIGPRTGPYISTSQGPFHFQFWVKERACRVQLRIDSGDAVENDEFFDCLIDDRPAIEQELGVGLAWDNDEKNRSNRIIWELEQAPGYRTPLDSHGAGFGGLADVMYRFRETLSGRIAALE